MVMITNSFDKFPNEPTGLMYEQFGKIGLNPSTVTFEDDFSTSPNGWTSVGSTVTISSGALRAVSVNTASDDRLHKGLGFTLSNSAWVCQFEVNLSTSNYTNLIALTDRVSNMNAYDTILCDYNGSNIKMREYNGSTLGLDSTGIAVSTGTQYYITLTRTGETGLKLDVRTGSHTGTVVGSQTGTISSGTVDLDTVQSGAYGRESGSASYVIDNLKIYNGVTSTTSPKVKQHFIEWFSGKQLPSYWDKTVVGSSTGAMVDEVGGGYLITTGTVNNDLVQLDFNDINQYAHDASEVVAVWKGGKSGNVYENISVGLMSATYALTGVNQAGWVLDNSISSNTYFMKSGNASGVQYLWTSVPYDTNFHVFKSSLSASGMTGSIDDVVTGTQTSNLPTGSMQPHIHRQYKSDDGVARTLNIRYMECYNT